jgi:predicted Fe-Mo cluster-binding NifX family protein
MKLCITSKGDTLESQVDPRFGRCAYFIIIDPESMEYETIDNMHAASSGGAGIQSGQLIADKNIDTVMTGNVGPNAFQTLQAAGIAIITGISGTVIDAVNEYKKGNCNPIKTASVESHFGMK